MLLVVKAFGELEDELFALFVGKGFFGVAHCLDGLFEGDGSDRADITGVFFLEGVKGFGGKARFIGMDGEERRRGGTGGRALERIGRTLWGGGGRHLMGMRGSSEKIRRRERSWGMGLGYPCAGRERRKRRQIPCRSGASPRLGRNGRGERGRK